jgi:hypothetical protein
LTSIPLGVQADGIWTEGQGEDFSLDLVMESKGMVTSDGYTIEVALPFKSLRYVAGKDKLWGIHFWRRTKRLNNSLDMWIPMDRDKNSWLAQGGTPHRPRRALCGTDSRADSEFDILRNRQTKNCAPVQCASPELPIPDAL